MISDLVWVDRVDSTLDEIHRLAAAGAPHGTAVVAGEQTLGRGARGNVWHSPLGGLWLSVLLRPPAGVVTELLSLRVGLTACDVLDRLFDLPELSVKWPNDLMLGGRKLGGVLCEARWQQGQTPALAVGLGINVANPIPPEVSTTAVALAEFRPDVRPDRLIVPMVEAIRALDPGVSTLAPREVQALSKRDWLRGRRLREPEAGLAVGIGADGALQVSRENGTSASVRSGHVVLA